MPAKFKVIPFVFLHRHFGDRVYFRRVEMGLTQKELGDAIARSDSYIATVENGNPDMDVKDFIALCNLFDFNPHDFFELED